MNQADQVAQDDRAEPGGDADDQRQRAQRQQAQTMLLASGCGPAAVADCELVGVASMATCGGRSDAVAIISEAAMSTGSRRTADRRTSFRTLVSEADGRRRQMVTARAHVGGHGRDWRRHHAKAKRRMILGSIARFEKRPATAPATYPALNGAPAAAACVILRGVEGLTEGRKPPV